MRRGPDGESSSQALELERYLHSNIPLSKAMEVSVVSVDDGAVVLGAPLAPNINHRGTVFGGSASTLATLAAWSLCHLRCRAEGIDADHLVIRRNTMQYERAMLGDFSARASFESLEEWQRFARTLASKGKARITITALEQAGLVTGRFSGEFVALR